MKLWGWLLYFVPKNLLSFLVGIIVSSPLPTPLRLSSMKWFANRYNINMDEAEKKMEDYKSINDLFTRKLKPGLRPISSDADLVHPADSAVTVAEKITSSQFVQAKGKSYSIKSILGASDQQLSSFEGGHHITYYLCPTDYHRVHSPVQGEITGIYYQPGRLWPVNPWSVDSISQLFAVNERVTIWVQTAKGEVAVTMVGATNVGKMTLSFEPEIITNEGHFRKALRKTYEPPLSVVKGQELGVFNMGSTVLLFLPKNYITDIPFALPKKVKYGQSFFDPKDKE